MIIGRSDSRRDAVFLLGASTPTGRLAAGCGSHLGQRSSTASKGRTHGALSTRFHYAQALQPGRRSLIAAPAVNRFLLSCCLTRGHGSLRGRRLPPQHLVRSTGAAMSTTGSRGNRAAQRPPSQLACTLAPVGQLVLAPACDAS